jgi:hypothetical protein
MPGPSTSSR